jgi:hypothetical protein
VALQEGENLVPVLFYKFSAYEIWPDLEGLAI